MMSAESKKQKEHYEPICFIQENFRDIDKEHDDLMVISTLIRNFPYGGGIGHTNKHV